MNATATLLPPVVAPKLVEEEPLFEIVNGQKVELPPMSIYANRIASRLYTPMDAHVARHGLGTVVIEALLVLDREKDIRRRPDIAFVGKDRWPLTWPLPQAGDWEVVPNLTVEVVSPTDLFDKVLAKKGEYFRLGVDQVWIVAPADRHIHVYTSPTSNRILTPADILDGGAVLPGLQIPIGPLFDPLPQGAMTSSGA